MIEFPVVEIFNSIQGEGIHTGMPATFIRLGGCNLRCPFCDTDHTKYEMLSIRKIEERITNLRNRFIVVTGGEPLIHNNIHSLLKNLSNEGYLTELETNGSIPLKDLEEAVSFISLSPKVPRQFCKVESCDSLKILYPYYRNINAKSYSSFPAKARFIQPIDYQGEVTKSIHGAFEEVLRLGYPWRLGLQLHKVIEEK
jgi:7-carboxy-7-deazaguanine synthase